MAILLTFAGLAESGNGLAVRPLSPVLSNRMYIVWKSARSSLLPRGTSWKSFGKMQKKNLSMNNKKGL